MKTFITTLIIFLFTQILTAQDKYLINTNRIWLPINNFGVLADVSIFNKSGGLLDDKQFLYSAGFFLSGKNSDTIWTNGVASASSIADYQPGNVDSNQYDPRNAIYEITPLPAFNSTWQKYRFAVQIGAKFYDGNADGIYNPVDLNGNGQWDPNEDRPDIIGDFTAWCAYNDGVPGSTRRYKNNPLGIEIHQTLFSYNNYNTADARSATFFVRYKIFNTGKVSQTLDSVYFGAWSDTDIGSIGDAYMDDLAGCDTVNNAGYIYNDGDDADWGVNPPAHFIKILQGPYAYIPGVTFIDHNLNGDFDPGVDTPLDTAKNRRGPVLGVDLFPGAKNLGITSYMFYISSSIVQGDPANSREARNYLLGRAANGQLLNPCGWGVVLGGVNCNLVNPIFAYSGDPVTQVGWLSNFPSDYRQIVSTGPFKLKVGQPIDIIVAHIAARGVSSLNSVYWGKAYNNTLQQFYNSNFVSMPLSVEEEENLVLSDYKLYQNYPNPFSSGGGSAYGGNSVTTIKFSIPSSTEYQSVQQNVNLKIYDILGNEVAVLVNEPKSPGTYEIKWDASGQASGIYFYQLRAGKFIDTKKMILLR